ncbi:MAG: DNA polymerase I, partial [Anaeromyxobacteraceae bacterium]
MPTLTLIDGSGFVFRAFHAIPHLSTTKGVPTNAVYGFTTMLLKALREHAPTHAALVLDASRKSFRTELDPAYKANRPEAPEELVRQFPLIREVARALDVPVIEEAGVEADDVIATLARRARAEGFDVVIVTGDKDFAQLVGDGIELYDPMAEAAGRGGWTRPPEVEKKLGVRPDQVVELMALTGDKVDNVPGVPGVGEVTASALVRHFGSIEAMLARPGEIPQAVSRGGAKLQEKVVANADRIRLNRVLVTLKEDVPVAERPADLARRPVDVERARALFTELEFGRLLRDLPAPAPAPPTGEATQVVTTRAALDAAVAAVRQDGRVGLRAAFSSPSPRSVPPAGLAFAAGGRSFYVPIGHRYLGAPAPLRVPEVAAALRPLLDDPAVEVHTHDLKSEIHALRHLGLPAPSRGIDTEVASRILLTSRREHGLADVARERVGVELPPAPADAGKGGGDPATFPVEETAAHAGAAAGVLPALAAALVRALGDEGLSRVHEEVERPLVPVLAAMEEVGVAVDAAAMGAMSTEFGAAMKDLEARIHAAAGRAFNVASTRELGQVLFGELGLPVVKRLKTGPSTDQDVLEKLAEEHPLPRLVLEHRSLAKLKGTYVDALPLLVDPVDHRIHTTFNQFGAATGRLSSQDPNLQNIPVRTELSRRIRAAFVAPPGRLLVSADYSQIELRILAHYAEDPSLLDAFLRREDVHSRTAAETFGVPASEVSPEERRVAKVLNFGIAYGLSAFGLAQRLDMPPAEAQAIIDRYFARYAGVKRWLDATVAAARESGEVRTLWGRRRELPEIRSRNPGLRQAAERMAVNTPIQGTAADIVKLAMLRVDRALVQAGIAARMILQVHDELVLEVAEAEAGAAEALLREAMEGAATLRVPLDVEVGK